MNESNRVAVVTGAGSGIGREVSARCSLTAIASRSRVAGLERALVDDRRRMRLIVSTDVTDAAAVRALFAACGRAGARRPAVQQRRRVRRRRRRSRRSRSSDWQAVVDTNLTGAFLCAQEAFRAMKAQPPRGGRIINNGSISAHVAAAVRGRLHGDQARDHRADQGDLPRGARVRHRLRADRHRQRRRPT